MKNKGWYSISRVSFWGAIFVLLILLTGCRGSSATVQQSPLIIANAKVQESPAPSPIATATMDVKNSLIFHIQGSVTAPGQVMVQYWSQGTGPFTTASVSTTGTAFALEVMRLRPSTQYNYQVFLVTTSNSSPVSQYQGTFTSGPLPPGLQNATIRDVQGTPTWDLMLLDYNCTDFNGIIAIDREAQIVWYFQNDNSVFTLTQEVNRNLVFNELSLVVGYTMKEIAPDGSVVHSVDDILPDGSISAPAGRWNHEMLVRSDNKIWTIGADIRSVNIAGKDTLQTGGTIEEWDIPSGKVTRLVNLFDLLDPVTDRGVDSDATGGFFWTGNNNQYAGVAEDWTHSNSLDVLPDGTVLISNRHLDQIVAIKPDFSGVAWKLGGVGSDFTFPDPTDQFYHQHYARMLPNGHILLFDNGNLRPDAQGGQYSRAEELELDFSTMQARKVWEYRASPDLFSSAVGSSVRLSNGNTVVDFGVDTNTLDKPSVFTLAESDPTGKTVSVTTMSSPGKGDQYRAIPVDSLNGETTASALIGQ
jgi:hypothetical protein